VKRCLNVDRSDTIDSLQVGLFRVFLQKEWEDLKDADTRPCKKQKTAAVQKTAAAKRPCICITLPFKPPEAFEGDHL
jgi:hypothetical protein